ncbi:MAG: BamA/TamA family outer membrane protein [bacterium]
MTIKMWLQCMTVACFVTGLARGQDQEIEPGQKTAARQELQAHAHHEGVTPAAREPIELAPQSEDQPDAPDPNTIPYRTRRSALAHFFSIPAKAWRIVWTPIGATVVWVEQNRVQEKAMDFFLNDARTGGFFPLVSFGGNTGAGAGLMVFHNNLFNRGKKIQASFLYSSEDDNTATVFYADSSLFGSTFYFDLYAESFNDSDENLYISSALSLDKLNNSSIGANTSAENDETSYATKQVGVLANLGVALSRKVGLGLTSSFKHADIDSGEGTGGDKFPNSVPGAGKTKLFSIGGTVTLNFTTGWPRTLSGPLLRLSYTYNREIDGHRFEYNRYTLELQQFVPVPFLARNRRLGIRGVFEKIDRIGDRQIPFYELSLLGDAANLRGFDQNRFRGRGSLLFNFEYRYPIWDTWDAVIFVDEGQVFDDLNDLDIGAFHTAVGAGVRIMTQRGFVLRFEVARGREMSRALFQITPNF